MWPSTRGRSTGRSGPRWDLKQANGLLDKVGLTKKDGEGYRLRTDGKGRVRIELMTVGGQFIPFTQLAEMIKQHWQKIGIDADVKETERGLAFTKTANAEHHAMFWTVGGSENLYLFPRHVLPVDPAECHLGMPFARWYASNGTQGKKPSNPEMLRAFELFRSAGGKKEAERIKIAREIWKILVEECWVIGTVRRVARLHGRADRQEQHGQYPHAADQRPAHADAQHVASGDVLLQVVAAAAMSGTISEEMPGRYREGSGHA